VAMKTDCFRANIDIYAINRANFAFTQHSQHARGCLDRIVEQSIGSRARDERSVAAIVSVSENFMRNLQTTRLAGARERAFHRREKNQLSIYVFNSARD